MWKYILKRLLMLIPVIIGVSLIVFFIVSLTPGDAALIILPEGTEEQLEAVRESLGLNKPLIVQYFNYMLNLCKGDFGSSYYGGEDVLASFLERLPNTFELGCASIIVGMVIAIPIAIYSATHQYSFLDGAGSVVSLLGVSMPNFWVGLLLMLVFTLNLRWLPSGGNEDGIKSLIMPAITLGTHNAGIIYRMTRSSMLEVIRSDFVRTARSKGLKERVVVFKHAMGNAWIPVVTVIGGQVAHVVSGSVVTEKIFSWPGVGRLLIDSINQKDRPMIMGILILITIFIALLNLGVDLIYAFIDPRVKAEYKK